MTGGLSAIDITVECTLSWRVRSNIRFLSAWAGGVLQILWSDWYREWTVFSRPARSQRAVSNPLRVESPSGPCSFYKQMFRTRNLADLPILSSFLFFPSLSLYLKSLWILLKNWFRNEFCGSKLWVIKWVVAGPNNRLQFNDPSQKATEKKQKHKVLPHNCNQFNLLSEIGKTVGLF